MVPLGVETSTAVATAAEGVAPGSFLDGLLAALNALSPIPTGATPTGTSGPTVAVPAAPSAPASIETMNVAAAVIPVPVLAMSDDQPTNPTVAVPKAVVATVEPAANPAVSPVANPVASPGVAKASPKSDDGGAVFTQSSFTQTSFAQTSRSVSVHPGRRVTLHSVGVESSDAPRAEPNTPQDQQVPCATQSGVITAAAVKVAAPKAAVVDVEAATTSDVKAVAVDTAEVVATVATVATVTAAAVPTKDPAVKDADVKVAKPKAEPAVASDKVAVPTEVVVAAAVNAPPPEKIGAQLPIRGRRDTAQSVVTPIDDASPRPAQHEVARLEPTSTPTAVVAVAIDHVDHNAVTTTTPTAPAATQPVSTPTTSSPKAATAPAGHTTPVNLGMIGVDRVRFAREQAPSRAVQRLSIDLDGAQVALRFRGDRVVVDVVNDPAGTLGNGWARQVERSLDQAVRTVSEPQRGGQSMDQHGSQPGGSGKGGAGTNEGSEHDRPRSTQRAFTLFDEEED